MTPIQVKLAIGLFMVIVNICFQLADQPVAVKKLIGKVLITILGVFALFLTGPDVSSLHTFALILLYAQTFKFLENMELKDVKYIKDFIDAIFK